MAGSSDINPHALADAPQARPAHFEVAGTSLYTEVRGSGRAVLLIGAADEDAEFYRPVAERLADELTVVTYDRRGTRRSGREDWRGGGSVQHADDAAALVKALGINRVTIWVSAPEAPPSPWWLVPLRSRCRAACSTDSISRRARPRHRGCEDRLPPPDPLAGGGPLPRRSPDPLRRGDERGGNQGRKGPSLGRRPAACPGYCTKEPGT